MVNDGTIPLVRYRLYAGTASLTAAAFTLPSTLDFMCILCRVVCNKLTIVDYTVCKVVVACDSNELRMHSGSI